MSVVKILATDQTLAIENMELEGQRRSYISEVVDLDGDNKADLVIDYTNYYTEESRSYNYSVSSPQHMGSAQEYLKKHYFRTETRMRDNGYVYDYDVVTFKQISLPSSETQIKEARDHMKLAIDALQKAVNEEDFEFRKGSTHFPRFSFQGENGEKYVAELHENFDGPSIQITDANDITYEVRDNTGAALMNGMATLLSQKVQQKWDEAADAAKKALYDSFSEKKLMVLSRDRHTVKLQINDEYVISVYSYESVIEDRFGNWFSFKDGKFEIELWHYR